MHLNINSFLPKINKLCYIAKCSNAAVIGIGITETKLDTTVYDSGFAVDVYNIIWSDRKRKVGDVAC